jgi:hypothetical protein
VLHGRHGRYEVAAEHGRGGFGVTYRGHRLEDGLPVILKVLRVDRLESWKAHELFEREAAVLHDLAHPGIPAWLDHFPAGGDGTLVLVQELISGRSLDEIMRAGGGLGPPQMRAWFEDILAVLDYLHGRAPPVIHRDVTPRNIMVRTDGRAALVDFGSVQAALREADGVSSTAAGTFGYAPLEQFVGRAAPASDLYGLGMTYLAVRSGREPSRLPMKGVRVDVRALMPSDDPLTTLIEQMTEPDVAHRPVSAAAVIQRLRTPAPTAVAAMARIADEQGYLELLRKRLEGEGFTVWPGGRLADLPLALTATRARGSKHPAAVFVYVVSAERLPGGAATSIALRGFVRDAAAAHPRPRGWLAGRRWVIPVVVSPGRAPGEAGAVAGEPGGPALLPALVELGSGDAKLLADPGGLGGEAATLLRYAWWLCTPRLAPRPDAPGRAAVLRVAMGVAAGVALLLAAGVGYLESAPHGTFFLSYAAEPGTGRVAWKALYGRRFWVGTDVLVMQPGQGQIRRARLPADASLCGLSGDRLGYWLDLGGGMMAYRRSNLDGTATEELVRAPSTCPRSCAVLGPRLAYAARPWGGPQTQIWWMDGATPPVLVAGSLPGDQDPAWFPDGSALVVSGAAPEGERLYRVELATGRRELLFADNPAAGVERHPAVSPDGRRIAFYRSVRRSFDGLDRRGGEVYDLELATWGDRASHLLLQDVCYTAPPAWRGDDQLVFAKWIGDRCGLFLYETGRQQSNLIARDY